MFLDGAYAFRLPAASAAELKIGQNLNPEQVEKLCSKARQQECLTAAERFLSNRPHAENELRQKLVKRGFESSEIVVALAKLKASGLIDDREFARFWTDNREFFRPRSKNLTALELKLKGVAAEIIDEITIQADDTLNAYKAALQKVRLFDGLDHTSFQRRLGNYLTRRGFGYEVTKRTVERIWDEQQRVNTELGSKNKMKTKPSTHIIPGEDGGERG